jgi:hypothetical protein
MELNPWKAGPDPVEADQGGLAGGGEALNVLGGAGGHGGGLLTSGGLDEECSGGVEQMMMLAPYSYQFNKKNKQWAKLRFFQTPFPKGRWALRSWNGVVLAKGGHRCLPGLGTVVKVSLSKK